MEYYSVKQSLEASVIVNPLYIQNIELKELNFWDLTNGKFVENWHQDTVGFYKGNPQLIDFPITAYDIPIVSMRLKIFLESLGVESIQYLPICLKNSNGKISELNNYFIANILRVVDAINRKHSVYQTWTKKNLMFWEKREWMLGTFRDVKKAVLNFDLVKQERLFRIKGWSGLIVIREDVKREIENANITGFVFSKVEVI